MIVECDRCSTKYRVREDRLPASGGNIKCPGCAHVFFVAPPSESGPQTPDVPATTTPSQLVSTGVHQRVVAGSPSTDAATRQMDAATLAAGAGLLRNDPSTSMGPPGGQRPAPAPALKAAPAPAAPAAPTSYPEDTSWKLKTSFGLVYDFPDTASLRSWLSARDDLAGYKLSGDGTTFKELSEFPSIMSADLSQKLTGTDNQPRSTSFGLPTIGTSPDKVSGGGSPPPPRPSGSNRLVLDPSVPAGKTKKPEPVGRTSSNKNRASGRHKKKAPPPRRSAPPPPEVDEESSKSPWVIPTIIFMVAIFLLLGLQVGGFVDFKKALGIKKNLPPVSDGTTVRGGGDDEFDGPVNPTISVEGGGVNAPRRKVEADDSAVPNREAQVYQLLLQAKQEMSKRDYDRAVLTLTSAKAVAPNDPEVFRLLDRVYTRQGNRDAARIARDRFKELKAKEDGRNAPN